MKHLPGLEPAKKSAQCSHLICEAVSNTPSVPAFKLPRSPASGTEDRHLLFSHVTRTVTFVSISTD